MQLSCLLLNQDPLREGRTAQLRKEQRNEFPGSNALPTGASLVPVSVARSPPPRSIAQGRSGTRRGARGPAPLRRNKARRGSSWPRSERVTKASRRCQAPRQCSYGQERRRPQTWVQFAPRFLWASLGLFGVFFPPCVPKDLLDDSAFIYLVLKPHQSCCSLVPAPVSSISPSFFLHLNPFTSAPSCFEV